jgi:uncharacterized membrane protein HdeD (DUF308 family)
MITDAINQLSSKWWTFLLRGIVALAVAAFAFMMPAGMATALIYIFAAYFIISGAVTVFAGVSLTGAGNWWLLILLGAVEAILGFIMLTQPGARPLGLAYLFAIWLILSGTTEISAAMMLRGYANGGELWWILLGLVTLAIGIYVVINPALGVTALVYTVGIYAVLAGISLIVLSFRIKGLPKAAANAMASL